MVEKFTTSTFFIQILQIRDGFSCDVCTTPKTAYWPKRGLGVRIYGSGFRVSSLSLNKYQHVPTMDTQMENHMVALKWKSGIV